ncbi:MAG: molybdenum cofactor guanylyltransferase [Bacteroidetes bacterium]|jgi:molybdopterin-guanine dinucleotide biosynthesis protein A|nr:molybdopterin-guanine dinucleotide biosynthesis protein MobA [Crocinitomicaceae bacterium]MCH9822739.1 molybdenum cofactor guanylyltransferase [Bacteroidota bacterium]|tara:strand:+ start:21728 stop:22285 length:558 start_codon:yes stop_codon:yes gene_type:complete
MEIQAVILAGGKSSRMGTDKGLLEIAGKPMVQHLIETLQPLAANSWISTSNKMYIQFGVSLLTDEYDSIGPLGGIHIALQRATTPFVLVVSVDAPFVSKECILKLKGSCEQDTIVISRCAGKPYPLIGCYPVTALKKLEEYIDQGNRSVFGFLESQKVKEIEFSDQLNDCFRNINTPQDLSEVQG